jgi:hypothetical protein
VIDLREVDGTGKRLQAAGLKTLGEIEEMEGPELLKLPGLGVGVIKRVRAIIKNCKAVERRRRAAAAPTRLRAPRVFRADEDVNSPRARPEGDNL